MQLFRSHPEAQCVGLKMFLFFFFFLRFHASSLFVSSPLLLITRTSFPRSLLLVLTPSVSCSPPPLLPHNWLAHRSSTVTFFFLVYVFSVPEWKIYELRDEILEGKKIQVGSFQSWEHWKVELAHAHAHTPQAVCPPSIIRVNTVELAFKWWSLWTIFLSSVLYHSAFGVSALSQCFHSIPASGILASLLFVLLHYSCHKGTRLPFGGEKSNNP